MTFRVQAAHVPGTGAVSSPYGPRRGRMHNGIDIGVGDGTAYAIGDGTVTHATQNGARGFACYGVVVVVRHPQWNAWSFYAHLESTAVAVGDTVTAGQALGRIGSTNGSPQNPGTHFADGRCLPGGTLGPASAADGRHLHFEVSPAAYPRQSTARRLDPLAFLRSKGIGYTALQVRGRDGVTRTVWRPDVAATAMAELDTLPPEDIGPPRPVAAGVGPAAAVGLVLSVVLTTVSLANVFRH